MRAAAVLKFHKRWGIVKSGVASGQDKLCGFRTRALISLQ